MTDLPVRVAAVDLGATSGRVMTATVGAHQLQLDTTSRFPNDPVRLPDGLHWNMLGLYRSVLEGLGASLREGPLDSVGVDSWAVDYALLRDGRMLGNPYHYRDLRTGRGVAAVHATVPADQLYAATGLQHLPFNTLFQLAAESPTDADTLLLIPDLLNFWLTGRVAAERTNASTTGLLEPSGGEWNRILIERLGLPGDILPPLIDAGSPLGPLRETVATELDAKVAPQVIAVASHDTASAVVAVPASTPDFAYISCGTWGLVGVELEKPVLSEASRLANFTNERGVDGRVRYLHNVMGLWLLTESVREWERSGEQVHLPQLLEQAAAVTTPVATFDPNDPLFLPPGNMAGRITEHCRQRGLPVASNRAEFTRSILESLAGAFAEAVWTASALASKPVGVIHLVGGGSQNTLLCQLTADRAGLPVLAGPVEATALGNVLIQARALGAVRGDLEALRRIIAVAYPPRLYQPRTAPTPMT